MAEPQANTQSEQSRAKENAAQAEPRSFNQAQAQALRGAAAAAQSAGDVARTAADGGRQIAEAGADAGRLMAESWRRSLDPFMAMQVNMNRWVDDLWRQAVGFDSMPALRMMRPFGPLGTINLFAPPAADLKETKDAHLLTIELPGLTKDDIDISLQGDTLIVRGQKIEENEDASCAYRVSERRFGRFERSFPLPADVDRSRIQAQFRDGVLRITEPKRAEAMQRQSKIEVRA
jgi:HSP20 family protein